MTMRSALHTPCIDRSIIGRKYLYEGPIINDKCSRNTKNEVSY